MSDSANTFKTMKAQLKAIYPIKNIGKFKKLKEKLSPKKCACIKNLEKKCMCPK